MLDLFNYLAVFIVIFHIYICQYVIKFKVLDIKPFVQILLSNFIYNILNL